MHVVSPVRLRVPLVALAVLALLVQACGDQGTPSSGTAAPSSTAAASASAAPTGERAALDGTRRPVAQPRRIRRPPGPGGGAASRSRSSPTGSTRRCGSTGSPTAAAGSRSPSRAGRSGSSRTAGCSPTRILDITDRVLSGGERGLLGLAFPPGFGDQHQTLFVHYSDLYGRHHHRRLRRARRAAPRSTPTASRILFTADQPYANHNGGWIGFDPTGMLLIALGDGGAGGDPENRASNLGEPLGKMLRIDVLNPGDGPYAIPPDNPFVGPRGRPPGDPPLRPAQPVPRQRRPGDRRPLDRRRGPGRVGGGRRRAGRRPRPRLRLASLGGQSHCYDPPTGCDPTGVTMPVTEYPHTPGLRGHRRRRLPRRRDPGAAGRLPVLRQLLRDAVGDRRRARGRRRRRSPCSRPVGRSARSASTTRARWS